MKILHVVPSYVPAYRYGGPIKATHELCRALVQQGLGVSVVTTTIDRDATLTVPVGQPHDVDGVQVTYYPVRSPRSYCYAPGLGNALRRHIPEFDLVHIHSVYLYPTLSAAYWCRHYKKPYLLNPFGALDPAMVRLKSYLWKTLYIRLVEERNIAAAAAIHVASSYEKERFESMGFGVPVVTVPRGLNVREYEHEGRAGSLAQRYPVLQDKRVVLFLGRIHMKKGLDLLAHAFSKVAAQRSDVYLVIAGPDEGGYIHEVKRLFEKLQCQERIIFTGMLLGEAKLSALYGSDLFVLSSRGENFGLAVLEAMACKLPVIITTGVGLSPDVERSGAGIITDCNAETIARAISQLADDAPLRKAMGERGRRLVEEQFTWDHVVKQMTDVYQDIAG